MQLSGFTTLSHIDVIQVLRFGISTISTLLQLHTRSLFTIAFPTIPQPLTLWCWVIFLPSSLHYRSFRSKHQSNSHFSTPLLIAVPNTPFFHSVFHLQSYSNHQHDPRAMLVPIVLALVVIGAAIYWFTSQEKRVQLNPRQYQKFKLIFKVCFHSPYYLSLFRITLQTALICPSSIVNFSVSSQNCGYLCNNYPHSHVY